MPFTRCLPVREERREALDFYRAFGGREKFRLSEAGAASVTR